MNLNPSQVPAALVSLLPWAERWGIGDDYERDAMVDNATLVELNQLVHCIDAISDEELFGWLAGPESYNSHPTKEYLAITCLTMAIDLAKLRLKELT